MRNVARLKMGYYPLPEPEGTKLRSLLSFAGPASVIDPCVGQGTALHIVTSDSQARRYGVELDAERARIASANGIATIQGNAFDAIARPESFSLLYLNPPYDSEIGSIANRRMEAVFLEHTYRWLAMEGVLILVIPFERLHDCAGTHQSRIPPGDTRVVLEYEWHNLDLSESHWSTRWSAELAYAASKCLPALSGSQ